MDRGGKYRADSAWVHTEGGKEVKVGKGSIVFFTGEDASELERSIVVDTMVNVILEASKVIQDGT